MSRNTIIDTDKFIYRDLELDDFHGYMSLLYQLTNYKHEIDKHAFADNFDKNILNRKIYIICDNNEIIGGGSIYKLAKLHNNPVGHIEDIIIDDKYRGQHLGKKLIEKLVHFGLTQWKCYKITLNCLSHNIQFYEKCGFTTAGNEMKYIQ
jgi:glucosamine-phosphate N-acetyltransferase